MTSRTTPWAFDPIERARYLDGECAPEEKAARDADLVADPAARSRVEREAAFLAVLRRGAEGAAISPSEFFEARLLGALASDRAAGLPPPPQIGFGRRGLRRRVAVAVAASLAVLAGTILWASSSGSYGPTSVGAANREVIIAAETYREARRDGIPEEGGMTSGAGCAESDSSSPRAFPPIRSGELQLASCAAGDAGGTASVSVLRAGRDGRDPRGLVVTPYDGKGTATDVGYTRLGDVVVFDVTIGRSKYYLATRWETVAGTASCAACHGPARADNPARNPHTFVDRTVESR